MRRHSLPLIKLFESHEIILLHVVQSIEDGFPNAAPICRNESSQLLHATHCCIAATHCCNNALLQQQQMVVRDCDGLKKGQHYRLKANADK